MLQFASSLLWKLINSYEGIVKVTEGLCCGQFEHSQSTSIHHQFIINSSSIHHQFIIIVIR